MVRGVSGQRKLGSVALDGWPHANPTNPNQKGDFSLLDDAFAALDDGELDAVVGENNQLKALTSRPERVGVELVGPIFESFDYGIGLTSGSPIREDFNTAILRMREDGTVDRIFEKWLGRHD